MNDLYETTNFRSGTSDNLECPCCGLGGLSVSVLIVLEDIRRHFNKPVTVNSGARCVRHNSDVGGMVNSQHVVQEGIAPPSQAADIVVQDTPSEDVFNYLKNTPYANLLGLGSYATFTHVDTRGWGARW